MSAWANRWRVTFISLFHFEYYVGDTCQMVNDWWHPPRPRHVSGDLARGTLSVACDSFNMSNLYFFNWFSNSMHHANIDEGRERLTSSCWANIDKGQECLASTHQGNTNGGRGHLTSMRWEHVDGDSGSLTSTRRVNHRWGLRMHNLYEFGECRWGSGTLDFNTKKGWDA